MMAATTNSVATRPCDSTVAPSFTGPDANRPTRSKISLIEAVKERDEAGTEGADKLTKAKVLRDSNFRSIFCRQSLYSHTDVPLSLRSSQPITRGGAVPDCSAVETLDKSAKRKCSVPTKLWFRRAASSFAADKTALAFGEKFGRSVK